MSIRQHHDFVSCLREIQAEAEGYLDEVWYFAEVLQVCVLRGSSTTLKRYHGDSILRAYVEIIQTLFTYKNAQWSIFPKRSEADNEHAIIFPYVNKKQEKRKSKTNDNDKYKNKDKDEDQNEDNEGDD